ncbi:hypothetical protein P5E93_02840 [Clostridium perfringens]|nr:hypothetical protein [Clostridium perfringens]
MFSGVEYVKSISKYPSKYKNPDFLLDASKIKELEHNFRVFFIESI